MADLRYQGIGDIDTGDVIGEWDSVAYVVTDNKGHKQRDVYTYRAAVFAMRQWGYNVDPYDPVIGTDEDDD